MKISEILQSTPEFIASRIGAGPYLYYDSSGEIRIECDLRRIIGFFTYDGEISEDISVFAYGFKKNEGDTLQYINPDDLNARFSRMSSDGSYEIIEPKEENGIILQVPTYCDFDTLMDYYGNGDDLIVNCRPLKEVIEEELKKRIDKSDSIRK